jgi:hypothetical protein
LQALPEKSETILENSVIFINSNNKKIILFSKVEGKRIRG